MRKVILGVSMSLDGRIARANGGVDFLRTPKEHPIGVFFACSDYGTQDARRGIADDRWQTAQDRDEDVRDVEHEGAG